MPQSGRRPQHQERTSPAYSAMSALPPKADKLQRFRDVRFVPKADLRTAAKNRLFDHPIGKCEELRSNCEPERPGGLEVDDQVELGTLDDR